MANDTCSICLEPLLHYDKGTLVPIGAALCGHCFHCDCFWRWDEAKRAQDWRRGLASRGCPCPVCNVNVDEFIKLFISGDATENERLRKELKELKQRLARELDQLEMTRRQLKKLEEAESKKNEAPKPSSGMLDSSRRILERDIKELCETVSTLLSNSPKSKAKAKKSSKKSAENANSYRRHESCPLEGSASFPETMRNFDQDRLCITNNISMPPDIGTRYRPRRNGQDRRNESRTESPRRRSEGVPHRSSPDRTPSARRQSRGRPTPEGRRSRLSQSTRPDPPTPEPGRRSSGTRSSSFMDSFSAPQFFSYGPDPVFDDPPSCQPNSNDSIIDEYDTGNAPTPTRRTSLVNFLGTDPPSGLLGGCIYID